MDNLSVPIASRLPSPHGLPSRITRWRAAIRREDTFRLSEDLKRALERNAEAQANFEKFPASQKKQFLYWIASARTEKTRQKRIQSMVEMAAKNKWLGEK
jgi:uncharacterized protein YdeI (YjbR/CyaY-like superfamily)